jgi:SAM-dependent methyltransferase
MIESAPWRWSEVTDDVWTRPSEEAHYLAARWYKDGRRRLLDLGCGTGRHAVFFAEQGFSVDAFDLSKEGIERLETGVRESSLPIRTRVGDMLGLPYSSAAFDCLLAFHVIYHTDRTGVERTISEIYRVLARGGEAYISFNSRTNPSFADPANRQIDTCTVVPTQGFEKGIPHYYVDEPEIRRLLSAFEFIRFTHVNEISETRSGWHYFLLIRKPAGRSSACSTTQ